ncbi:Aspartate-semialdehyde dehydrogenase [Candidatus Tremblaya princeps]|uniref:Aspartate-semialdehyde dehydrogenase n=1 Tax=Tremblaya princeps TaxID=189385 RepID=A0A143WN84_TREPR|nr:Aspartate-semialdehyde dehydrogenase [Candidatus Tremblaya princeps]
MVGSELARRHASLVLDAGAVALTSSGCRRIATPAFPVTTRHSRNARALLRCKALLVLQGGVYTRSVAMQLRCLNWAGHWIDASSELRHRHNAAILVDPINDRSIMDAHCRGVLSYAGGNCTVSLLLLAIGGLVCYGLTSCMFATTMQAASGAGAPCLATLAMEMRAAAALPLHAMVCGGASGSRCTVACSVTPWVDIESRAPGVSREEQKGATEAAKILGRESSVRLSSLCTRVGVVRCHSQSLFVALRRKATLGGLADAIQSHSRWVLLVRNSRQPTMAALTPAAASGSRAVVVGRLRAHGVRQATLFTVGDQLLWGAVTPVARMLLRTLRTHYRNAGQG